MRRLIGLVEARLQRSEPDGAQDRDRNAQAVGEHGNGYRVRRHLSGSHSGTRTSYSAGGNFREIVDSVSSPFHYQEPKDDAARNSKVILMAAPSAFKRPSS